MLEMLLRWYRRRFADPQAIALLAILIIGFLIVYFLHSILAPLFVAIVLSYFLDWPITKLEKRGLSRVAAVSIILGVFIALCLILLLLILPIAWQQGVSLFISIPSMINELTNFLKSIPKHYPTLVNVETVDIIMQNLREKIAILGDSLVNYSLASVFGLVKLVIYCVLIPIMMFFLLKDKKSILSFFRTVMPKNRVLADRVWVEMNKQISNYVRGKIIEIIAVGIVTYLGFWIFGLNYSILLAIFVGISVIIPYIGAVVVSIPVLLVGLFQFGFTSDFGWMVVVYLIIQGLDSNLLVPLLFSEAVNLHPLVIILAVIVFGGIWGMWGVFFAIPLASLIKTVINVWPEDPDKSEKIKI